MNLFCQTSKKVGSCKRVVTVFHATKGRNFIAQQSYKRGNLGLFPFACARILAIHALSLLDSIC